MKYEIENEKGGVKISFQLTKEEWDGSLSDAYNKYKGRFSIPGFRKGKAPRKVIENMYGPSVFFEDAFNDSFPERYETVLSEHPEIYPVDSPEIDFEDISDNGISFTAFVTVKPEVKLGAYKGLTADLVEVKVTASDIDAEVEKARERAARKVAVDRPVEKGDFVTLDYSGSVDGEKFDGGTAEKQELEIGSNSFIPGFEDQMIGMKTGEEKDLNVKFPEEYHAENLKGKDAVFHVKLHEIKVKEYPALDDEFAKDVSTFNTFKEYKDNIKLTLTDSRQKQADGEMENSLIEKIVEGAEAEIPQAMINTQLDYMLRDFEYRLMYQGMKLDDYFKYTGSSVEDFRRDRAADAEKTVKSRLVIEAIVKAEDMKVDDAEADAKIEELAAKANKELEEFKKDYDERRIEYLKNDLLMDKLLKFLKKNNSFVKPKAEKAKDAGAEKAKPVAKAKAAKKE